MKKMNESLYTQGKPCCNCPGKEPVGQKGSTFALEDIVNSVLEGDCLEYMRRFPDNSMDMVLCDLPYGTTRNKWDSVIPLCELWKEYMRIVKDTGAIVLTSQGLFTAELMLSNRKMFRYKLVWEKSKPTNFLNAKRQPLRKYEDVCVFYKRRPVYHPQMLEGVPYDKGVRKCQQSGSYGDFSPVRVCSDGKRYPTDIIYFKTAESEGNVIHPTQKPVALGRYLVRTYTSPGGIVLDNTFGSGSFLVAALLEGRNFVGIERNRDVELFKGVKVDCIAVATGRLREAWDNMGEKMKSSVSIINLIRDFEDRTVNFSGTSADI